MQLHPANCDNAKPWTLAFSCSNLCIFPNCSCQKSLFHQHKCALHQHLFFQLLKQQKRPAHLPLKAGLPSFSWLNASGFSQLISHTSRTCKLETAKFKKCYGRNCELSSFLLYCRSKKILSGVSAPPGMLLNSALVCHPIKTRGKHRANAMCHQQPFIKPECSVETWAQPLEATVREQVTACWLFSAGSEVSDVFWSNSIKLHKRKKIQIFFLRNFLLLKKQVFSQKWSLLQRQNQIPPPKKMVFFLLFSSFHPFSAYFFSDQRAEQRENN